MACNCTEIQCLKYTADSALQMLPHLLCDLIAASGGGGGGGNDFETEGPLFDWRFGTARLEYTVIPNALNNGEFFLTDVSVAHIADPFVAMFVETSWGDATRLVVGTTEILSLLKQPPNFEYVIYITVVTEKGNILRWNNKIHWDGALITYTPLVAPAFIGYSYPATAGTCFRRLTNGVQTALVNAAGAAYVVTGALNGYAAPLILIPQSNGMIPPIEDIIPTSFSTLPVDDVTVITLGAPVGTLGAVIQVEILTGTGAVRFTLDGVTVPTTAIGFKGIGGSIIRAGKSADREASPIEVPNFQAICEVGTTANLSVQFYS